MGDCADDFNALKQVNKDRKAARREANMQIIRDSGIEHTIDGNGSVHVDTPAGKVIFYPSTNRAQHKGEIIYGDAHRFISYIKPLSMHGIALFVTKKK